jgi:hypothetical protein
MSLQKEIPYGDSNPGNGLFRLGRDILDSANFIRRIGESSLTEKEATCLSLYFSSIDCHRGPLRLKDSKPEIVDHDGKTVNNCSGINVFGLMNETGFPVQPGHGPVDGREITAFLGRLRETGFSYIRFLFPATPYYLQGKQPDYDYYKALDNVMGKLDEVGLGGFPILNYWEGFAGSIDPVFPENLDSEEYLAGQRRHLEKVLRTGEQHSSFWGLSAFNEVVLFKKADLLKPGITEQTQKNVERLFNYLRTLKSEAGKNVFFTTGFIFLSKAGILPVSSLFHYDSKTYQTLARLYNVVDSVAFIPVWVLGNINSAITPFIDKEVSTVKKHIPFEIAEVGVPYDKTEKTIPQLKRIGAYIGMLAYRWRPELMAFWQIISDERATHFRNDFDKFALSESEFKHMLELTLG